MFIGHLSTPVTGDSRLSKTHDSHVLCLNILERRETKKCEQVNYLQVIVNLLKN